MSEPAATTPNPEPPLPFTTAELAAIRAEVTGRLADWRVQLDHLTRKGYALDSQDRARLEHLEDLEHRVYQHLYYRLHGSSAPPKPSSADLEP